MADQLELLRTALAEHYAVERVLGQGGSATVYLARDLQLDREVAIKVLRPEIAESVGAERFAREIKVTAHLQHPHIVPVTESGTADGLLYLILPYVQGESLRGLLQRTRQLDVDEAVRLTREIADGLAYAHSQGFIHRDIKPENVLLSGGHAVITDFGLTKAIAASGGDRSTGSGIAVGTPWYMSPEQASAAENIDARTDQYSLACVLYEMLAGEPPFSGATPQAVAARHMHQTPPGIRIVRPGVSPAIAAVLERGLAKVPADRFKTVADFSAALEKALVDPMVRTPALSLPRVRALVVTITVLVAAWLGWQGLRPRANLPLSHVAILELSAPAGSQELVTFAANLTSRLTEALSDFDTASLVVTPHRIIDLRHDDTLNYGRLARKLNVATLIAGSVVAEGGSVHIALQLYDGRDASQLGTFSFDWKGSISRIPRVDDVAEPVADSLRQALGAAISTRRRLLGTTSVEARKLLQDAESRLVHFDAQLEATDSMRAARQTLDDVDSMFRAAERLDSTWIEPIISRSKLTPLRIKLAAFEANAAKRPPDGKAGLLLRQAGVSHADRAVRLAPDNPRALYLRGSLRNEISLRSPDTALARAARDSASADFRKALDLSPHYPQALLAWSKYTAASRSMHEAIQYATNAYKSDAFLELGSEIWLRLFEYNFRYPVENDTAARKWCTQGARHFPTEPAVTSCQLELMAWSDVEQPDPARARSLMNSVLHCVGCGRSMIGPRLDMLVGVVCARAGERDSARAALRRGLARPSSAETVIIAANILTLLGEKDRGVELIVAYATANPKQRVLMQGSYGLRALRREPRVMRALEPPPHS